MVPSARTRPVPPAPHYNVRAPCGERTSSVAAVLRGVLAAPLTLVVQRGQPFPTLPASPEDQSQGGQAWPSLWLPRGPASWDVTGCTGGARITSRPLGGADPRALRPRLESRAQGYA